MKEILFIDGALSPSWINELINENAKRLTTGAYTIFCGQVRADEEETQIVKGIEYVIYESMAQKILIEQIQNLKEQFQIQQIYVLHSKGFVPVGALSVILFVTSSHRKQALLAQEALLPIIKFEVPIWKKEIFQNLYSRWT